VVYRKTESLSGLFTLQSNNYNQFKLLSSALLLHSRNYYYYFFVKFNRTNNASAPKYYHKNRLNKKPSCRQERPTVSRSLTSLTSESQRRTSGLGEKAISQRWLQFHRRCVYATIERCSQRWDTIWST